MLQTVDIRPACARAQPHVPPYCFSFFFVWVCVSRQLDEQAKAVVMSMRAHSTAVQDSLKGYTFGRANDRKIPSHRLSDSQVRTDKIMELINPPPVQENQFLLKNTS